MMKDLNDYQDTIVNLIHEEFLRSEQRNEKTFEKFKEENSKEHLNILSSKEKEHSKILGKIDRGIEVANALASEMRGCYSAVEARQTEYEKKQAINTYQIATVVAGVTFAATFFLQYLWDILTKKS